MTEENKNIWPDEVREKMIEKGSFYNPPDVYHYGYYDGYQHCNKELIQLKERLEKTNNHLTDLVWLFEHGATSEELTERIGIINTFLSEQTKKQ